MGRPLRLIARIGLSLIIHLAVISGIPTSNSERTEPVVVELSKTQSINEAAYDLKRGQALRSSLRTDNHSRKRVAARKALSQDQSLGILDPNFAPRRAEEMKSDENVISDFSSSENFVISSKSYDESNALRGFLNALYSEINGRLLFDSVLAQFNHFGTVFVQFRVSRQGKIIEDSIRVKSNDRILQVYVLRTALIPALSQELKQNLWSENEPTLIGRFEFKHMGDASNNQTIIGTSFSFARTASAEKDTSKSFLPLVNCGIAGIGVGCKLKQFDPRKAMHIQNNFDIDPYSTYESDKFYNF